MMQDTTAFTGLQGSSCVWPSRELPLLLGALALRSPAPPERLLALALRSDSEWKVLSRRSVNSTCVLHDRLKLARQDFPKRPCLWLSAASWAQLHSVFVPSSPQPPRATRKSPAGRAAWPQVRSRVALGAAAALLPHTGMGVTEPGPVCGAVLRPAQPCDPLTLNHFSNPDAGVRPAHGAQAWPPAHSLAGLGAYSAPGSPAEPVREGAVLACLGAS